MVPKEVGGERSVAVLLSYQEEEGRTHGDVLAVVQLLQADGGRHVVVSGLVSHSPPHVHRLEVNAVLLSAGDKKNNLV